jgi:hypothetical protein
VAVRKQQNLLFLKVRKLSGISLVEQADLLLVLDKKLIQRQT